MTVPGGYLLGDLVPGVGLGLLHAQGDFLLLLVDVQDDDLDLVADRDQLAGVVDALGPAHLGDVDQALDALLELDEGAVAHHVDDLALVRGCRPGTSSSTFSHGLARLLLEAQGDLLAFLVDVEDHDLDLLVDLDHLAGVVDAAPAHVGDVQQAVDAAEVDERAEVGDVLDDALADLARLDLGEQLLLLLARACSSISLRRLTTMLRRLSSILRILHSMLLVDVVADVGRAGGCRPGWRAGRR